LKKSLAALATLALALLGVAVAPTVAYADGTITVTLEDQAHAPILGAQVSAYVSNGSVTLSPVIGVPGAYMSPDLTAGTYGIVVVAPGYARQYWNGSISRATATPVVVTDGGGQTLAMTLVPESVISGTITDHTGAPYQAVVGLYSDVEGGAAIGAVYSDSVTGYYEFPSLPAGDYRVAVQTNTNSVESSQWHAQANSQAEATVISLGPADSRTVDIQLALAGTLAGSTTNAIGSPVRLEIVAAPSGAVVTSSNGTYSFGGLLPDTYTFTTRDSADFWAVTTTDAIAITAGTTTSHDFVVTPRLIDEAEMLSTSTAIVPSSGPTTVEAGGTYTWTVTTPDDGDLYAVLYSDPVLLAVVPENGDGFTATVTVTIPASTPAGSHRLAIWANDDADGPGGPSREYFPLEVTRAELAATGVDSALPFGAALVLLVAGTVALAAARRRDVAVG